jgi:hypothetical protein
VELRGSGGGGVTSRARAPPGLRLRGPTGGMGAPAPVGEEREWAGGRRREEEEIGGTHMGKIVISVVGLTPLPRNVDRMAHR